MTSMAAMVNEEVNTPLLLPVCLLLQVHERWTVGFFSSCLHILLTLF